VIKRNRHDTNSNTRKQQTRLYRSRLNTNSIIKLPKLRTVIHCGVLQQVKNVSVVNIKTWNNLKADVIYVGQKLVIKETVTTPAPTLESNKPDSTETDSTPTVSSSYQVKNGDTLWGIATSKNVSVVNIKTWNNLKADVSMWVKN